MVTDFIQGDKFEKVAHFTFAPVNKSSGDYSNLMNTFSIDKCLEYNPCIVYTHTFYVKYLFDMLSGINHKFIVVTHNCDTNVDFLPPPNVIKWYTQNLNIRDDRMKAIPIGLENNSWFVDVNKKEKMIEKYKEVRSYTNLAYMNFNISTNPSKRQLPFDLFKDKPWVTTDMGANGNRFDEYLDNIYKHKFVICPEGNGIDTHRVWEALYMDVIPIVKRNILSEELYSYFPVLIVDKWEDVSEWLLNKEFEDIQSIKNNFDGHNEMLTFEYWKNKIQQWI